MKHWRTLAFMFIALLIIATTVSAAVDRLTVPSVRAYVDGTRDQDADESGGYIDSEVFPGSEIKLKLTLRNEFTRDQDTDIDDIVVYGVLEDVDLGADLEQEVDVDSIPASKTHDVTLVFNIPQLVNAGTYDLTVTIEGDSTEDHYETTLYYTVRVIKKDHDVRISKVTITDNKPLCGETIYLTATVQNYGLRSETAKLTAQNLDIGINYASQFTLSEDIEDPTNEYIKNYPLFIPQDASGSYELLVQVTYLAGKYSDKARIPLVVTCTAEQKALFAAEQLEQNSSKPTISKPQPVTTVNLSGDMPTASDTQTPLVAPANNQTVLIADGALVVTADAAPDGRNLLLIIVIVNVVVLIFGAFLLYIFYRKPTTAHAAPGPASQNVSTVELDLKALDKKLDSIDDRKRPGNDKLSFY